MIRWPFVWRSSHEAALGRIARQREELEKLEGLKAAVKQLDLEAKAASSAPRDIRADLIRGDNEKAAEIKYRALKTRTRGLIDNTLAVAKELRRADGLNAFSCRELAERLDPSGYVGIGEGEENHAVAVHHHPDNDPDNPAVKAMVETAANALRAPQRQTKGRKQ